MNKATKILGGATLALLFFAGSGTALAYHGDTNVPGPNYDPDRRAAVQAALESGDYYAWIANIPDQARIRQYVNADNFHQFREVRQLALRGDFDGVARLKAKLGLPDRQGKGQRKMHSFQNQDNMERQVKFKTRMNWR